MNRLKHRPASASPLAHTALQVTITDLVAEYELRHEFSNDGKTSMEAVYSFPVPLDSAFLGMEATLAGERRLAQVQPRQKAQREYGDAIADGNSAVLLERLEPGMLCVSLGNLKPEETGEIVLRFAAPLRSADGAARFSLPLVHRPRYGRSSLDELDEPQHDFAVEHPLAAEIRVVGLLAQSPVTCATHGARFSVEDGAQVLRLNHGMLDRDLVLVFDLPEDFAGRARLVRDDEAAIGFVTFTPAASLAAAGPCDVCLVLDGSGSMTGDAISQSRAALCAVAEALTDDDRIQVLRFGSTIVPLFRRPLKASARVREAMAALADTVNADLGGTDMDEALNAAMDALTGMASAEGQSRAIILVTDGAIQPAEIRDAQARATKAGIRIFVVAVGSSAGVDVLAPMASATGAVLERAVPAEPIDEAVMRQLRRARQALPLKIEVDWGCSEAVPLPIDVAYPGDAVTAMAKLPDGRDFNCQVKVNTQRVQQEFMLSEPTNAPALRALYGHAAWQHSPRNSKEMLALRYGLLTDETSAVLVKVRAEEDRVEGLPQVVPVAHMVPEGMVQSGRVAYAASAILPCSMLALSVDAFDASYLDTPAFSRRPPDDQARLEKTVPPTRQLLETLALALVRLLLGRDSLSISRDALMTEFDPALRPQLMQYLSGRGYTEIDRSSALSLLDELLTMLPEVVLADEEEAQLAELRR